MLSNELQRALQTLRLSGMIPEIPNRVKQAVDGNVSHEEFLLRLFTDEVERRHANRLQQNFKKACFPEHKEMEDFDFAFNPSIPKKVVVELGSLNFVGEARPVIFCGPTGVGKSHLAQALGQKAVRKGYKVRFAEARDLFLDLRAKRADGTHEKQIKELCTVDLLVLDDLGLHPFRSEDAYDFYDIIRKRHGRRATILTSNRDIKEWADLFPDRLIANAALDRLLENCVA